MTDSRKRNGGAQVLYTFFFLSDKIKKFLTDFYVDGEDGKVFTYAEQLTNIAHREQIELVIDLDDVGEVRSVV